MSEYHALFKSIVLDAKTVEAVFEIANDLARSYTIPRAIATLRTQLQPGSSVIDETRGIDPFLTRHVGQVYMPPYGYTSVPYLGRTIQQLL